jgi:hypothetical protein
VVEKGLKGMVSLTAAGSFAALRMTARTNNGNGNSNSNSNGNGNSNCNGNCNGKGNCNCNGNCKSEIRGSFPFDKLRVRMTACGGFG